MRKSISRAKCKYLQRNAASQEDQEHNENAPKSQVTATQPQRVRKTTSRRFRKALPEEPSKMLGRSGGEQQGHCDIGFHYNRKVQEHCRRSKSFSLEDAPRKRGDCCVKYGAVCTSDQLVDGVSGCKSGSAIVRDGASAGAGATAVHPAPGGSTALTHVQSKQMIQRQDLAVHKLVC